MFPHLPFLSFYQKNRPLGDFLIFDTSRSLDKKCCWLRAADDVRSYWKNAKLYFYIPVLRVPEAA